MLETDARTVAVAINGTGNLTARGAWERVLSHYKRREAELLEKTKRYLMRARAAEEKLEKAKASLEGKHKFKRGPNSNV